MTDDPRLLEIIEQSYNVDQGYDLTMEDSKRISDDIERLIRAAYEAGARRVVESWTQAGTTNCVTELGAVRRCK